jgi:hypothetical protein
LFADAVTAGRFVQEWIGRLADLQATNQLGAQYPLLQQYLFVQAANGKSNPAPTLDDTGTSTSTQQQPPPKTTCIVDLGVYTRNRLFRLLGSSKFGKPASAALRIADSNEFPFPAGFANECFYMPAMQAHLQQQADNGRGKNAQDLDEEDDLDGLVNKFVAATDWTLHAEALAQTLVVPLNVSKIDFPILPYAATQDAVATDKGLATKTATIRTSSSSGNAASPSTGVSPYPAVERFVHDHLATRGGTQGSIRAWSVDVQGPATVSITFQMSRNRWCECVRREHKSNNIMWTIDLVSWQCVQSCHDPECRSMRFRGTPIPVPASVREIVEDALFEEQLACLDEDALLQQARAQPVAAQVNHHHHHHHHYQQQDTVLRDDDEAFERALMALNLDGGGPSQDESTAVDVPSSTTLEQADETCTEEAIVPVTPIKVPLTPSPPARPYRRVYQDSDSDSDIDLVPLAATLERRKAAQRQRQQQEALQQTTSADTDDTPSTCAYTDLTDNC